MKEFTEEPVVRPSVEGLPVYSTRNGNASPLLDSSGSDGVVGQKCGDDKRGQLQSPGVGLVSRSFTHSDSAIPLSYGSSCHALRGPSLPLSTDSDAKTSPPAIPIRTTSSPQKHKPPPIFVGREWVLEKAARWLQLPQNGTPPPEATSCTFIVVGGPGSGKTCLFKQITRNDSLELTSRVLAYHACSNQFAASLNLPRFILSLRDQLASRTDAIGDYYRGRLAGGGGRIGRLFTSARLCAFPDEVLSEGVFKVLADIDPSHIGVKQKFFIAVDSADECLRLNPNSEVRAPPAVSTIGCTHKRLSQASSASDNTAELQNLSLHQSTGRIRQGWVSRNFLELLAINALFLPPWIGLFITCRRESQTILRRLFRCAMTVILDDTRCPSVAKDINDYVYARLRSEVSLQNCLALCPSGGQEMLQMLQYKSNASFLYLKIVLTAISECWLTPEYIRTIPGTLSGLFLWLCQRLLTPLPNDATTSLMLAVKPVLNLILTSPRPLTLPEIDVILHANNVSTEVLENWRHALSLPHFLTYDYPLYLHDQPQEWVRLLDYAELQQEKVLAFEHTSLRDWFLDVKYSTPVYVASSRDGHTMLAIAALNQITKSPCLSHSFTWDILYNFTRSNLYNSAEALHRLTSALRDVKLDFSVDTLGNLDCWSFLHDPILVHCSFAGSSISQLIEDALNYEHRSLDPQTTAAACNGTRPKERKPKPVILQTGSDKETSIGQLCTAAFQGKLEVVKTILKDNSVDVDARDAAGSTPLVLASRQGHLEIVKCLLAANARLDQIDQDGWSALRSAAWGGHRDVVKVLLEAGVDVDIVGPDCRTALRAAAWAGHEAIVQILLFAGADVDKPDAEGRTPLIAAAYMGCIDVINILADAGANLNHADQDGRTALSVAAFCVPQSTVHTQVVSNLLQLGANPNIGDRENVTPLIGAANSGRREVCELCLEADADVDALDKSGRSALVAAVVNGHVEVVQLLLFWCASVDTIDANGRSVLSIAAACGHTEVVRKLLDRGLDEAHRDHMGATPLHLASAAGHADVVRLLLESGAHLDETDNAGQTPLLVACQADHLAVIRLLLMPAVCTETGDNDAVHDLLEELVTGGEEDVDPHRVYDPLSTGGHDGFLGQAALETVARAAMDGRSPLRAAALNNNIPLVKLLLALGADLDQQDACGRTTLSVVVLEGLVKMTKVLLCTPSARNSKSTASKTNGANPLVADDEGRCPLHIAAWQGQIDLVYLLLQVGTPVDVRDKENRTPLHSAAWQNHAKVCRVLVEQGANVNAVCSQGASALCIAAQEGHLGVCEVLLQCGANAQQVDAYGRTAYKVALKAGHNDICALLERFGGILATPPRIRHRWKQMTPTGIAKSSQQQTTQLVPAQSQKMAEHMAIQRQAKFESDQARSPRTTVEVSVAPPNAFVGQVNIGCATATTGSVVLPQGDDALGSYARPSIASMNTGPTPPPHQQHFKQQSHPQFLAHHWPAQQMAFDPNQWQPVFPQGLHFSPNPTWCHVDAGPAVYLRPPVGSNQKSLYTPPVFFAPQVAASFDPHQLHQQPAYVLSPQGFLVPAQAPYFVPAMHQHQNAPNPLPSGFHQAIGMTQVHGGISPPRVLVPQQRLTTVPNTTTAASTMEKEAVPPCTTHSQRPPSFAAAEDVGGTHHTHHQTLEQPTNLTFTASSIASPFVSEAPMSYHYSATTPTTQEDFQKPTAAERPTIQLIVNTKLGEDVINLNEVTDSEYESSVWVSRRQVTVIPAEHTGRLGKPGAALKKVTKANRHGTMPEGHHHGSKVKAVIQGAWKGARRKKTAPGASKSSTIPVRDKKGEKQSQPESHI